MVLFMTSSPDGHTWDDPMSAVSMDAANDFINNLKKFWKDGARGLFVACNPADYAENDKMSSILMNSLKLSGLEVLSMDICDDRNTDITKTYDFMILAGGHLPTQNEFFKRINMKETVNNYEGIVIGISAGTMNCAKIVYSLPEEEGETFDENFDRFPEGLGLTRIQVIPHYQYLFDKSVDGRLMIDELAAKDSIGHEFYLLNDGSYFLKKDGIMTLYGEAYLLKDGVKTKICENNQSIVIEDI